MLPTLDKKLNSVTLYRNKEIATKQSLRFKSARSQFLHVVFRVHAINSLTNMRHGVKNRVPLGLFVPGFWFFMHLLDYPERDYSVTLL